MKCQGGLRVWCADIHQTDKKGGGVEEAVIAGSNRKQTVIVYGAKLEAIHSPLLDSHKMAIKSTTPSSSSQFIGTPPLSNKVTVNSKTLEGTKGRQHHAASHKPI